MDTEDDKNKETLNTKQLNDSLLNKLLCLVGGRMSSKLLQLSVKSNAGLLLIRFATQYDWQENSLHSLNRSGTKLAPITTRSPAFSRALGGLLAFALSPHWHLVIFSFLLKAFAITLG